MSEDTPTIQDFAIEVAYVAATLIAASVVVYGVKKLNKKVVKTVRRSKSSEKSA